MAKQQVYSNDDDLIRVPLDQEVLVQIDPEDDGKAAVKLDKEPADKKVSTEVSVDDTVKTLNDQIEALKVSNQEAEKRLRVEQTRVRQIEEAARGIAQEAEGYRSAAERSQHNNLKSYLQSAQSDQETHKKDYAAFLEAGDFVNAAEAQAKMSRAAARVVDAEKTLAQFEVAQEEERERVKTAPQRQPVQQETGDVIASIDSNPGWLPEEKKYLKQHPELLTDNQKNAELGIAYNRAMAKNLSRGTPEYFAFIDDFMGFKPTAKVQDDEPEDRDAAAPVRRENAGGRTIVKPNQVKLSPEQREIARNMGISELGYARQQLRLQSEKVANPEKYNRQR